jgi:hypothetical protein
MTTAIILILALAVVALGMYADFLRAARNSADRENKAFIVYNEELRTKIVDLEGRISCATFIQDEIAKPAAQDSFLEMADLRRQVVENLEGWRECQVDLDLVKANNETLLRANASLRGQITKLTKKKVVK